jgi:SAM-dependent methyltransferase
MTAISYGGTELPLFALARNWKAYVGGLLAPYIGGDVLEVGAGIGASTLHLRPRTMGRWLSLEPDPDLCRALRESVRSMGTPPVEVLNKVVGGLGPDELFDTILYLDVLEHIPDDHGEMAIAAQHLRPRGHLVVLSPAHQFLFSPFDEAVGHLRRYNRATLLAALPPSLRPVQCMYIDSVGLCASLANRLILGSHAPTRTQLDFWDGAMVPLSRHIDHFLGHQAGKSIVVVAQSGDT